MRIKVDQVNDALYFRLDESAIVESEEVQPGIILDFDAQSWIVGIEILGITGRLPPEELKWIQFETA